MCLSVIPLILRIMTFTFVAPVRACLSVLRIMTVLIFLAPPTPTPFLPPTLLPQRVLGALGIYTGLIHRLNSTHVAKTVMGDVDIGGTVYDTCSVTVNLAFACGLRDCALTRY